MCLIILEMALQAKLIPVVVHDCVEPVCDGKDCAVFKLCADRGLDEVVCF